MSEQTINCVGVIMDGNRRWARAYNKPTLEGHRAGYEKLREVAGWAREAGIKHLIAYTFSTENWNRTEEEVGYLLKLFRFVVDNEAKAMIAEHVRVRFVGDLARFPEDLREGMKKMEEATSESYETTLYLAVSYGGRAEILSAVNDLIKKGDAVDEATFSKALWTKDMPDPDIIIRTGGERRLSGFLPWQGVYSELFFVDAFWPEFSEEMWSDILKEFMDRERRMGK